MKDLKRRVRALHELPQALEPPRDLWPQIEAQLHAGSSLRSSGRIFGRRALPIWCWTAAAAFVVLAAEFWGQPARVALQGAVRGTGAVAQVNQGSIGATPVIAEDASARREALLRSLNARLSTLPTPAQQKVRADLQVIERSIQDIQSALGRDPGNALLHELLRETEQDEQHLATTVREAGAWTEEASGGRGRVGS